MKKSVFIFNVLLGLSLSAAAVDQSPSSVSLLCKGQTTESIQNFINENNTFLLKLGYGNLDRSFQFAGAGIKMSSKIEEGRWLDHSDLMKKYRDNNFTYNQMSLDQLNRNITAYEAVKAAKELALYISALTVPCMNDSGHQEALSVLTSYLMKLKPLDLTESLTAQVKQRLNLDLKTASVQKPEEFRQILQEQLNAAISMHSKNLTDIISGSIFGPDYSRAATVEFQKTIRKLITPIVHILYMDHQIGRTQWLGRALSALQIRNGGNDTQESLKQELLNNGVVLENYIGETWLMDNESSNLKKAEQSTMATINKIKNEHKNVPAAEILKQITETIKSNKQINKNLLSYSTDKIKVPVHTMSYVLTRNINIESAQSPSLALPGNDKIGKEYNLIGSVLSGINVVDAEYVKDNGYGLVSQLHDRSFYRVLNNGFSHVGYVIVRKADGVAMSWIIDNYPTPAADDEIDIPGARFNAGGVRWVGLEQFYKLSQHTKIGIITPDAKLFHEYAKPQIQKWLDKISGGQEILGTPLYSAISPVLDASGKPTHVDNPTDDPWTMEIDSATFKKIHQHENDQEWFDSVTEAAFDKIADFMYQGLSFVWITPYGQYYKGGGYCSFTGVLGYNLGAGIEVLSTHKDKYSKLLLSMAEIHDKAEQKLSKLQNSPQSKKDKVLEKQLQTVVDNSLLKQASAAVKIDIYTPSGLPSQSYVPRENVYQVQAPFRDVRTRYSLLFDKSQGVLNKYPVQFSDDEMLNSVKLDPTEVLGVALDLMDVSEVEFSGPAK
ncbi:MAG: hypothetical protein ACXVCY_15705 [Pseudobdellovibrionaceae bacterium]